MHIESFIEAVLYNAHAIIPPQNVKFPVLPRKGEVITVDGHNFVVGLVDWDQDVDGTYKPTLHLEVK